MLQKQALSHTGPWGAGGAACALTVCCAGFVLLQDFRGFSRTGKPKVLVMSYPCFRGHKAEVYKLGIDVLMCDEVCGRRALGAALDLAGSHCSVLGAPAKQWTCDCAQVSAHLVVIQGLCAGFLQAHFLKNGDAQITQAVAGLSTQRRLLMSGQQVTAVHGWSSSFATQAG